jgi:beta-1,4-mannosyl-glycoprotein beta-1,4-N-acetylglucosaminyltransferase
MKVYDTFLFGGELEMLQCRLEELDSSPVYRHVIVEGTMDHIGNPKPLYFQEHREVFAPWLDKIIYVVADDMPTVAQQEDPWMREYAQREHLRDGLADAGLDDLVLVCDVDEIPSSAALSLHPEGMVALMMRLSMFAVDWVYREPTKVSIAGRYRDLLRMPLGWMRDNGIRHTYPVVEDAGWHFTWLGGPEAITRKALHGSCHAELTDMILDGNASEEWYQQGYTWHGADHYPPDRRASRMEAVDVDETWPAYIRERRCPASWFRPR